MVVMLDMYLAASRSSLMVKNARSNIPGNETNSARWPNVSWNLNMHQILYHCDSPLPNFRWLQSYKQNSRIPRTFHSLFTPTECATANKQRSMRFWKKKKKKIFTHTKSSWSFFKIAGKYVLLDLLNQRYSTMKICEVWLIRWELSH